MVHRPSPSSTIDEFDDNSRISRNIFAQVAKNKIELEKKINPKKRRPGDHAMNGGPD
jgi:hypothetical protein